MRCEYRSLRSYRDKGVVRSIWPDSAPDEFDFETRFIRPDRFRFAVTSYLGGPRFHIPATTTLLSTGGVTRLRSPQVPKAQTSRTGGAIRLSLSKDQKVQTLPSIADGVSALQGVSRRSSYFVPSLLLPESIEQLPQLPWKLKDAAKVDGIACHHVSAVTASGISVELWVSESDFLLRKIVTVHPPSKQWPRIKHEYLYREVVTNEPVADSDSKE